MKTACVSFIAAVALSGVVWGEPSSNRWMTEPSLSMTNFVEGSSVVLDAGAPAFGEVVSDYSAAALAALPAGSYVLHLSVAETEDHAGLSYEIPFTVRAPLAATIGAAPNAQGQREATLTFGAVDYARTATIVWGGADAGARAQSWQFSQDLGEVPAGAVQATFVLPAEVGTTHFNARIVLTASGLSASAYVQDGLVLHYDALENVGRGEFDGQATKWENLVSNQTHFSLSESGAWFNRDHLDIPAGKAVSRYFPTLSDGSNEDLFPRGAAKTVESVYWIAPEALAGAEPGKYHYLVDVCHDAYFTTRCKVDNYVCGIFVGADGASYVMRSTDRTRNNADFLTAPQAYSLVNEPDASRSNIRVNGTAYVSGNVTAGDNYCYATNKTSHSCKIQLGHANNTCAMNVSTVRVYDRALTDVERAHNYAVDAARFFGEVTPALQVPTAFAVTINRQTGKADVTCAPASVTRRLCIAWDCKDRGTMTNAWANVAEVGVLPAGSGHLADVVLPAAVQKARGARVFLVDVYDSTSYVQDDLIFHYDALENAGRGTYDAAATSWANLASTSSSGLDLDVSAAKFDGDHLAIPEQTDLRKDFRSGILSRDQAKTVESVYWLDADTIAGAAGSTIYLLDACHDGYFVTRCKTDNFTCCMFVDEDKYGYIMRGTDATRNNADFLAAPQTYSMVNAPAAAQSDMRVNGSAYVAGNATEGYSVLYKKSEDPASEHSDKIVLGSKSHSVRLNVSTVRIYSRALTDEERDHNARIDRVRYCGDAAPTLASDYQVVNRSFAIFIR